MPEIVLPSWHTKKEAMINRIFKSRSQEEFFLNSSIILCKRCLIVINHVGCDSCAEETESPSLPSPRVEPTERISGTTVEAKRMPRTMKIYAPKIGNQGLRSARAAPTGTETNSAMRMEAWTWENAVVLTGFQSEKARKQKTMGYMELTSDLQDMNRLSSRKPWRIS